MVGRAIWRFLRRAARPGRWANEWANLIVGALVLVVPQLVSSFEGADAATHWAWGIGAVAALFLWAGFTLEWERARAEVVDFEVHPNPPEALDRHRTKLALRVTNFGPTSKFTARVGDISGLRQDPYGHQFARWENQHTSENPIARGDTDFVYICIVETPRAGRTVIRFALPEGRHGLEVEPADSVVGFPLTIRDVDRDVGRLYAVAIHLDNASKPRLAVEPSGA